MFPSDVIATRECELATFADDTAIYASDTDLAKVCGRLQRRVPYDYFKNWKIRVNPTKTQTIYFILFIDVPLHGCFRPRA
jgi:hypothetical protein